MALWPGFVGPSYTSYSRLVECQRTVNWFTEFIETNEGKAPKALYRSPGLLAFCNTGVTGDVRAQLALNGHHYAVVGEHVIEVLADGSFIDYSAIWGVYIPESDLPTQMAASPTQLMIVGGGNGYVLQAATLAQITSADFPTGTAIGCAFMAGYFVAIKSNSQQFHVSAVLDCTTWDALDVSEAESRPDFIVGVAVRGNELWFAGVDTLQPYYAGAGIFPFTSNESAVSNVGVVAGASFIAINKTIVFVGTDENSLPVGYKMDGFDPIPMTSYAVAAAWQSYTVTADCVASTFQVQGHQFAQFYFPTAGKTWRVDLMTLDWTEASYWDGALEQAHRCANFVTAFGKILGGDRETGVIYDVSMAYLDDNGSVIRRERTAPHLCDEQRMRFFASLQLDGNVGIGLNVISDQPYYNPTATLYMSVDGGKTFTSRGDMYFGAAGQNQARPRLFPLGRGRDVVVKLVCSDPVDYCIAACYLEVK